jgi:integrase
MATDMSGRDRVAIGLMLYGGLRRAEAVAVTVDQIATIDGQPVIRNLHGKGGRVRTVPIPAWLFDEVYRLGMLDGPVLRNERGGPLSAGYLRDITRRHTAAVGLRDIAPHDLRRTKGAIAHAKGVPMTRIRDEYGHSSVLVTERYVGAGVDLKHPVCDALPEVG